MAQDMRMPALGQTTEDLKILRWLKAEGDEVALGDELLEVETDKANLIVESFLAGTLLMILTPAGQTVQVGELMAYVGARGEPLPDAALVPPPVAPIPAIPEANVPPATSAAPPSGHISEGRVLASPAARQLARDHGIDLATVNGSGPGGQIEVSDVEEPVTR